ncbi:MAG: hypothetical protein ACHQ1H_02170, partial [Nitrososphaerales archaeon]
MSKVSHKTEKVKQRNLKKRVLVVVAIIAIAFFFFLPIFPTFNTTTTHCPPGSLCPAFVPATLWASPSFYLTGYGTQFY